MFRTITIVLLAALTAWAGWWTWQAQTARDEARWSAQVRQAAPSLLAALPAQWSANEAVPVHEGARWRLDGYADDWPNSHSKALDAMNLRVGRHGKAWWFWLSVPDAERTHGFGGELDLPRFDHVRIQAWLNDGHMQQAVLVVTAPGALEPYWLSAWPDAERLPVQAVLRDHANGYQLEARVTASSIERMTWTVHDGQSGADQRTTLVPVVTPPQWLSLWRDVLGAGAVFDVQRHGHTWLSQGTFPPGHEAPHHLTHEGWRVRWQRSVASAPDWSLMWPWLLVLLVTLLMLAWEAWRRQRQSQRIERLQQSSLAALHRGGKRGYKHFEAEQADDEIGRLSHTLAGLLAEVENHAEYLSGLAGTLSHELQTPLAIVRSSLDNLELPNLSADEHQTYVARARDGLARMSHLVRQMAEASRLERALDALDRQPLLLHEWLVAMLAGYQDSYPAQDFALDVKQTDLYASVAVDLLAQALDKLVDNAASYAGQQGSVRLSLDVTNHESQPMAVVGVVNSGSQLPEGMQARLFDALVSVRGGQKRDDGAGSHLGLGLHVVRLIAKAHGGQVRARNVDAQHVIFELLLPLNS